jgi:hypothetical protein
MPSGKTAAILIEIQESVRKPLEEFMDFLLRILRILNYIFGIAVILIGIGAFILSGSLIPLLLALGLIAVGPLEDLLMRYLHLPGVDPEQTKDLINQGTSLVLVVFLLIAIFLAI